jgi:ATP-dependent DNA helicase RecQ
MQLKFLNNDISNRFPNFVSDKTFLQKSYAREHPLAQKNQIPIRYIYHHIERLILFGEEIILNNYIPSERQQAIRKALHLAGVNNIERVGEQLGSEFSMEELRVVRAKMIVEKRTKQL